MISSLEDTSFFAYLTLHEAAAYCVLFAIGLCMGSFASALVYRIPRGVSWVLEKKQSVQSTVQNSNSFASRSACPVCRHELTAKDLIPLFSWMFLKGRCRYCNSKIPKRYPLIELCSAFLCLLVVIHIGWELKAAFLVISIPFLLALFVIDLEVKRLPDQLLWVLFFTGFGFSLAGFPPWYQSILLTLPFQELRWIYPVLMTLLTGLVYALFAMGIGAMTSFLLGRSSLGQGDVKFFAVSGIWLAIPILPFYLIFSGVFGLVFGVIWRYFKNERIFPFGPSLIGSLFICVLFSDYFLSWLFI